MKTLRNALGRMVPLLAAALLCLLPSLAAEASDQSLQVSFKILPDPPRSGRNTVEVSVLDGTGAPVTNAAVEVRFYMAAMPSMNMPEMASTFSTKHAGNGRYQGDGRLVMGGTWDVTVTIKRNGQQVARKRFSVQVRG